MKVIKSPVLRRVIKICVPFVLIPTAVILGALVFDEKKHMFISLFVAVMSLILFMAGFEKKQIGARRAVTVAVMTALCVVGRFIPFFKPITAITVIGAVYLGGEAGFLIGSLSALISDFYFGQGPWTPFQMLAWGLIGLFAGMLSGVLKKSRAALLIYGVLSGIAFSFIMDVWTVIWYNGTFNTAMYLAAAISAIPYTVIYSVSNFIFLWFMAKPFGDKLERIRIKYGI